MSTPGLSDICSFTQDASIQPCAPGLAGLDLSRQMEIAFFATIWLADFCSQGVQSNQPQQLAARTTFGSVH